MPHRSWLHRVESAACLAWIVPLLVGDCLPAVLVSAVGLACHTALANHGHKAGNSYFCTLQENDLEIAGFEQCLIQGYFGSRLGGAIVLPRIFPLTLSLSIPRVLK
jgi:hypothetical protein